MNPFRAALLLISLTVGVVTGGHAFATDEAPVLDKPGHWRVMGQDDEHSTSRCIGKPDTPLCAIETIVACFVRKKNDLCKIGQGPFGPDIRLDDTSFPWTSERYRVVGVERISHDYHHHGYLGRTPPPVLSGDLILSIQERYCSSDGGKTTCRSLIPCPFNYVVRKTGGRWHVVIWNVSVEHWK